MKLINYIKNLFYKKDIFKQLEEEVQFVQVQPQMVQRNKRADYNSVYSPILDIAIEDYNKAKFEYKAKLNEYNNYVACTGSKAKPYTKVELRKLHDELEATKEKVNQDSIKHINEFFNSIPLDIKIKYAEYTNLAFNVYIDFVKAYKISPPTKDWENVDFEESIRQLETAKTVALMQLTCQIKNNEVVPLYPTNYVNFRAQQKYQENDRKNKEEAHKYFTKLMEDYRNEVYSDEQLNKLRKEQKDREQQRKNN